MMESLARIAQSPQSFLAIVLLVLLVAFFFIRVAFKDKIPPEKYGPVILVFALVIAFTLILLRR